MGLTIGKVVGQSIGTYKGLDNLRLLQVELFDDSPETIVFFDVSGTDTAPVNDDMVIIHDIGGGFKITLGTRDPTILVSLDGEKRIYSRDSDGNIVATIYLKQDGTLQIDTDIDLIANVGGDLNATISGSTIIESIGNITSTAPKWIHNGDFEVNGNQVNNGTLTVSGIIKSLVDIIADYAGAAISALLHFHLANLGVNSGAALPVGGGTPPPGTPASTNGSGDIIDGSGTNLSTHNHTQPNDSNGDTESPTSGPL